MQIEQRVLQCRGGIAQLGRQFQIVCQGFQQLARFAFDDGVGAADAFGDFFQEGLQEHMRRGATPFGDLANLRPRPLHAHPQLAGTRLPQGEDGALRVAGAKALRHGAQQIEQALGHDAFRWQRAVEPLSYAFAQRAQRDHLICIAVGVRRTLCHDIDQGAFDMADPGQPGIRGVGDALAKHDAQAQIVGQQPERLEVVQGAKALVRRYGGRSHDLVGCDAIRRTRIHDEPEHRTVALARFVGQVRAQEFRFGFIQRGDLQAGGEHAGLILLAPDQPRPLEPGDGSPDFGLGVAVVDIEADFVLFAEEELARRDHDDVLAQPILPLADGLEHADEVAMRQARACRQGELGFHVLLVVQQHAACSGTVPPGASRLLEIVLEGAGDIGVHHEANIGLVDTHPEGVGRHDDAQRARDEVLLDLALGARLQAGVEMGAGPAARGDQLGQGLGVLSGRGEDDGAAGVFRQGFAQQFDHAAGLLRARDGYHLVVEIGPRMAAGIQSEVDAELGFEVLLQIRDHVQLGRGGEAGNRRQPIAVAFADERRDVQIIRAEIVPPPRQAMRLVEDPGSDLAPLDRVEKLLLRNCSGETRTMPASPRRIFSRTLRRSGGVSSPLRATAQ